MIWATGDCHGNFERFRPEYFPEAIPVHTVFKQIHKKGYSVQDALASARLLEALGFLEKTVPQKLYMGEKEVRDSAGHPITIQKYQIPEYGADIREV